MRALLCESHGPPETLVVRDVPSPAPGPREVLVRVRACGVNFPDLLLIENKYQFRPELPFAPGAEIAGEVAALGSEVSELAVGDRVIGMIGWGGFQEETVCPADRCLRIPDGMDDATAAAFTLTYGTSYHALVDRARLRAGESLVVLGATGGVGTAAVDIGRQLGARVIAAGGSEAKLATLQRVYGVEEVIDHTALDEPFKDRVNAMTGGKGADVIYDPVGGELFQQALRCIAWEGRILIVGFAADGENLPQARTNLLLLKGSALVGVFWGRFTKENPEQSRRNFERLFAMYAEGRLHPHVSHRFPLERGVEALEALANREVVGKCVITME